MKKKDKFDTSQYTNIEEGQQIFVKDSTKELNYFLYQANGKKKCFIFSVKPANDDSKPKLYISSKYPDVGPLNFEWMANTADEQCIRIFPGEKRYSTDRYFICVHSKNKKPCSFYLTVKALSTDFIFEMNSEPIYKKILPGEWCFLSFRVPLPCHHNFLHISASPGPDCLNICASPDIMHPTSETCKWNSLEESQEVSEPSAPILSPFQLPTVSDNPSKIGSEKLQNISMIIEGKYWKFLGNMLHLGLRNICSSEITAKIQGRKIQESDLLDPATGKQVAIFNEIFGPDDLGKEISHGERAKRHLTESDFAFGEIELPHFLNMLKKIIIDREVKVFYDLGSGAGKALIAALMDGRFEKIIGIEYLEGLVEYSKQMVEKFICAAKTIGIDIKCTPKIICDDILNVDWSDADAIYLPSLCFSETLLNLTIKKGLSLKKGALIFSLRVFPESTGYIQKQIVQIEMTFGICEVFIYEVT